MVLVDIFFALSLLGIIALFAVKLQELRSERVLFPVLRQRIDREAHVIKDLMIAGRKDLSKLPPLLAQLGRLLVHQGALGFANLAGAAQHEAHRLADLASHKRSFQARETRSEFLKKVAEHKNGSNGDGDTTPL